MVYSDIKWMLSDGFFLGFGYYSFNVIMLSKRNKFVYIDVFNDKLFVILFVYFYCYRFFFYCNFNGLCFYFVGIFLLFDRGIGFGFLLS